jgi:hypothetical protein
MVTGALCLHPNGPARNLMPGSASSADSVHPCACAISWQMARPKARAMVAPMGPRQKRVNIIARCCWISARSPISNRHGLGAHLDRDLRAARCVLDRVLHEVLQHREERTPVGSPVHRLAVRVGLKDAHLPRGPCAPGRRCSPRQPPAHRLARSCSSRTSLASARCSSCCTCRAMCSTSFSNAPRPAPGSLSSICARINASGVFNSCAAVARNSCWMRNPRSSRSSTRLKLSTSGTISDGTPSTCSRA